jgi:hypothetical protein
MPLVTPTSPITSDFRECFCLALTQDLICGGKIKNSRRLPSSIGSSFSINLKRRPRIAEIGS